MKTLILLLFLVGSSAFAEDAPRPRGQKLDLKALQNQYAKKSDSPDVEIVQDRYYTKAKKFELGVFGSVVSTDPFLSVKAAGASFGFHPFEYFGFNVIYFRDFVSPSSAAVALKAANGAIANTNDPQAYLGGEVLFYPLYGKFSFLGVALLHADAFVSLGGGMRYTDSGKDPTVTLGLGGQLYLSRFISLKIEYRFLYFNERLIQKYPPELAGTDLHTRGELSGVVSVGLTLLFGP